MSKEGDKPFTSNHYGDGRDPFGGSTFGVGFCIAWQCGPMGRGEGRKGPNGADVEDVIEAVIDRLEYLQTGQLRTHHDDESIGHLREALAAQRRRRADREYRRVEGTNAV